MRNFFSKFAWTSLALSMTCAWLAPVGLLYVAVHSSEWEPGLDVIAALIFVGIFLVAIKSFAFSLLAGFLAWASNGRGW